MCVFLLLTYVFCRLSQQAMVKLLVGNKACMSVSCETSLNDSTLDATNVKFIDCQLSEKLISATGRTIATPGAASSATQVSLASLKRRDYVRRS